MPRPDRLFPLTIPPGVAKNGTTYQNKGRWVDAHLVRWFEGTLRPIGGWRTLVDANGVAVTVTGRPRAAHDWSANDSASWVSIGTHTKLFALSAGVVTDITPASFAGGCNEDGGATGGDYGDGLYGIGPYGVPGASFDIDHADTWSLDNFGEHLLAISTCDRRLLEWDKNIANNAEPVAGAPTNNQAVVVTPERFVFVLGANGDPRLVKWPDQETTTVWTPTPTNQAGDFPLATRGKLLAGKRGRRETLLWTDVDLHGARYIGGDFIYTFERLGNDCGLYAPNAVTFLGDVAIWMSQGQFFLYDGAVRPIPCDVSDFVFGHLNTTQRFKIVAVPNPQYGEVTWYYPSTDQGGLENDRYVTYNVRENHWTVGALARAAGVARGVTELPLLVDPSGNCFEHEVGQDRGSEIPYVESGPIEIEDGNRLIRIQRLMPDERTLGDVAATLFVKNNPTDAEITVGPFALTAPTSLRATGRQVRLRLVQNVETDWRVGTLRLGGLPLGGR